VDGRAARIVILDCLARPTSVGVRAACENIAWPRRPLAGRTTTLV